MTGIALPVASLIIVLRFALTALRHDPYGCGSECVDHRVARRLVQLFPWAAVDPRLVQ